TYFTPQEKLLNFSFSPPIYFGLMIPFLFGLYKLIKNVKSYQIILLTSLTLIIPSLLAKDLVNLDRLILIMPSIIFLISYGLVSIFQQKSLKSKIALWIVIILVVVQVLVSLTDISTREYLRFQRYFGENITQE